MARLVTIVTGPIVGLRSTWLLGDTVRFAARVGKRIEVFDLFEEVLTLAGAIYDNQYERAVLVGELLDGYQYQFDGLRQQAYRVIAAKVEALPARTHVIVRAPASLEWRGVNVELRDHRVVAELLRPDRVVTLIDAEWKILERLRSEYGRHVLRVVAQSPELGVDTVLRWLGSEVSRSEDLADWCAQLTRKPVRHYVLATQVPSPRGRRFYRDVDSLTKVVTERSLPSFYASYSMTVASARERAAINDAIWRLRSYGLVIDPGSIEIAKYVSTQDRPIVFAYTVFRDLRWDVAKVDIVAALHPYAGVPPLSTGMLDEIGHARAFRKERYLVMPTGTGSPFTRGNYVPQNHVLGDVEQFFIFLERRRRPPLRPRFAAQVESFRRWGARTRR